MADRTASAASAVPLMPWEKAPEDTGEGLQSSFERMLDSDPNFGDEEQPKPQNEPAPEGDEPEGGTDEVEPDEVEPDESDEEPDEDEDPDSDEDDDDPTVYTVKVNGKDREVTLPELLAGYSRTADYTQKTQTASKREKEAEAREAEMREARDAFATNLEALQSFMEETMGEEPDWDQIRRDDPQGFPTRHAEWQLQQTELDKVRRQREALAEQQATEHREDLKKYLASEYEKLVTAIPEWKDPKTATKDQQKIAAFVRNQYGFTDDELEQVRDSRIMLMMRDAMKGGDVATARKKVGAKVETPTILRPGARTGHVNGKKGKQRKEFNRRMDKLAQDGSRQSAAEVFEMMLPD